MSDNNIPLSELSTKEDVVDYLSKKWKLKENVKNLLLSEFISGDILPSITEEDLENLGIKIGPKKNIMKTIEASKSQFKTKELTEKITAKSTKEEVKSFFERCLEFKGDLNSLDGNGLLNLEEEEMKKMGLKLGQRKRLIKYIEYFKTIKETNPEEEEENIIVSRESSEEEVSKFLKIKLKFSNDSINLMELDGESLFDLKEDEVDKIKEITTEEKENLKKFLKDLDKKEEIINIDINSSISDICNFLKKKLNFSEKAISYIINEELDADIFFALTENDIKKFEGISEQEKEALNIYLTEYRKENEKNEIKKTEGDNNIKTDTDKKIKQEPEDTKKKEPEKKEENIIQINKESKKEDIIKYLSKFNLKLETLTESELNKINDIKKEEKEIIKKFLIIKDMGSPPKINLNKDNNENNENNESPEPKLKRANKLQDVVIDEENKFQPAKIQVIKNKKKENEKNNIIPKKDDKNVNNKSNNLPNQNLVKGINPTEKSDTIKFSQLKKLEISPLLTAPYNIFFFITLSDKQAEKAILSVYLEEGELLGFFNTYYILNFFLISKNEYKNDKGGNNYYYLIQVPLDKQLRKLSLSIKKDKKGIQYEAVIDTNNIENYFQVNNLKYNHYDDFPFIDTNSIFTEYFDYFWDKKDVYSEKIKKKKVKKIILFQKKMIKM